MCCAPALPGRRISLESWQAVQFLRNFEGTTQKGFHECRKNKNLNHHTASRRRQLLASSKQSPSWASRQAIPSQLRRFAISSIAGYRIIPVNPHEIMILGEKCYARLEDIP